MIDEPMDLEEIAAHARFLDSSGQVTLSRAHAEVCVRRQVDSREQELRSFIVKHSVVRIHFVVAFAMVLIAGELFLPVRPHGGREVLVALITVAGLVIRASTRTIGRAVPHQRI
jgi:hypothetical protein